MKIYHLMHESQPEINQFLYFIGPTGKEVLGQYIGGRLFFNAADNTIRAYYSKYWRELTEQEMLLVQEPPEPEVRPKRKYTRRVDK